ncbi:FecR domain-containing protein [Massilibacteroides sp.]|uniref:FecR family protein n=1 Tax=Massilibacteroides sp. TaxID=2034766 RepID=UPI0026332336|nr:FecR domain-containing protein [Massilibacteroides sp.]MDD4515529.1 FecR domain-containing protein [Massilibacteroides sp.]
MINKHEDKFEQRIRFVAKYYRKGAIDADKAWTKFAEREKVKQKYFLFRYRHAVAAVILLCLTMTTWYFMTNEKEEWLVLTTASGQVKNVFLPDSSMALMAENSTIKYDLIAFKKGSREVEMKGKIFFQVKRMESSPFSVSTVNTVVTVLGTSFQLDEKGDRTELYVNTGKVAFADKDGKEELILTAGMSAVYKKDEASMISEPKDNTNALSWKTKELHFNNTPLKDVIGDLSEYYHVKIINRLENGNKHLTASFNNLPLDEVLLIINQTLDVHLVVE